MLSKRGLIAVRANKLWPSPRTWARTAILWRDVYKLRDILLVLLVLLSMLYGWPARLYPGAARSGALDWKLLLGLRFYQPVAHGSAHAWTGEVWDLPLPSSWSRRGGRVGSPHRLFARETAAVGIHERRGIDSSASCPFRQRLNFSGDCRAPAAGFATSIACALRPARGVADRLSTITERIETTLVPSWRSDQRTLNMLTVPAAPESDEKSICLTRSLARKPGRS